jgi:hypothetical protein
VKGEREKVKGKRGAELPGGAWEKVVEEGKERKEFKQHIIIKIRLNKCLLDQPYSSVDH